MPTATRTSKPPSLRCKKGRGVVTLTDEVYAERDMRGVAEVMKRMG